MRGRGVWLGLIAAGLLISAAAGPSRAGSPPIAPETTPPMGMGVGMGRMGQRSADAHLITMMIPHHDGAIAMAELALTRARHPELKALAERSKTSQTKENAQRRQWHQQWFGGPVPVWPGAGRGMGMGMGMPGMATSLQALRDAPDFDRAFLVQMIAHHRMGVMMASHAQWGTVHPELRELEGAMVRVQSEEIAQMELWYQQWLGQAAG
ncbi:MAG: DUF305 domain-containing protein [Cyanobacteriota bacterium]|nr:DUF305 domain-containing protein [Cyanobacteriota bacterium]